MATSTGTTRRRLADDRTYTGRDGADLVLAGRALMFVRNVGLLMTTDALRDGAGREVPEGILDAVMTVLAAVHDLRKDRPANSRTGAVYVVKPKLHGPAEATFTDELFTRVESLLGLPARTVKIGLMDEERRTSANLAACTQRARRPGGVHQHGVPGPHRRRDPHLDGGGADGPEGRHEGRAVVRGLRGPQRRHRLGLRVPGTGPDRQGDVARSRSHGGDARGEDRPPAGWRELRLGALPHGGDVARHPLPPRRRSGTTGGARRSDDAAARRAADRSPRRSAGHRSRDPPP